MGHFSVEISRLPGSVLSGNQHSWFIPHPIRAIVKVVGWKNFMTPTQRLCATFSAALATIAPLAAHAACNQRDYDAILNYIEWVQDDCPVRETCGVLGEWAAEVNSYAADDLGWDTAQHLDISCLSSFNSLLSWTAYLIRVHPDNCRAEAAPQISYARTLALANAAMCGVCPSKPGWEDDLAVAFGERPTQGQEQFSQWMSANCKPAEAECPSAADGRSVDELIEEALARDREAASEVGDDPTENIRLTPDLADRFERYLRRIASRGGVRLSSPGTSSGQAIAKANDAIRNARIHGTERSLDQSPEMDAPAEVVDRLRQNPTRGYTHTVHHSNGSRSYQIHVLEMSPYEMRQTLLHEALHIYAHERGLAVGQLDQPVNGTRDPVHAATRCLHLGGTSGE